MSPAYPSAFEARHAPRQPRPARSVLALVRYRAFRRWARRALSLALVLACLSQSLPAAAYQAQPRSGAATGPARYITPGDGLPVVGAPARVIGPAAAAAMLSDEDVIKGITVYTQSDVDCASPQYAPTSPSASASGTTPVTSVARDLYICSTGAMVHISLYADAEGWGCNIASAYLHCMSSGCTGPNIDPESVQVYGTYCVLCNRMRSAWEGDIFLPAGKYRMHAEAGMNLYCGNGHYEVAISVSAPQVSDDRCRGIEDGCPSCPQESVAKPVNTRTGNFTHSVVDFTIPTRGLPLTFERTYNSRDTDGGPLGVGWTHNYGERLIIGTDTIKLVASRGSRLPYYRQGDGSYAPGPGVRGSLVKHGDGTYTLTQPDQVVLDFDASGHLTSLEDNHGNATTLTYTDGNLTAITAPDGRALTLAYDGEGHITDVTDPLSRTVHYTYTAGALTAFADPLGQAWDYGYDAQGRMTTFMEGGSGTTTNVYDSQGRVVTQRDALDQEMTFDYSADHTVVTDAAGTPLTYTYSSKGVLTAVTDALGHTTSYRRDNDYNLKKVTDARGYSTYYTYNDCGCAVASVEDALGNATTSVYDGHNNLLQTTDPLTHTTHFAYDAADNLVAITNTLGYTSTFTYDAQGQLIAATDPRGHESAFGYDDYGNLSLITDTRGHVTAMAYDLWPRHRRHRRPRAYDHLRL